MNRHGLGAGRWIDRLREQRERESYESWNKHEIYGRHALIHVCIYVYTHKNHICIHIPTHTHTHTFIYTYAYIHTRERGKAQQQYACTHFPYVNAQLHTVRASYTQSVSQKSSFAYITLGIVLFVSKSHVQIPLYQKLSFFFFSRSILRHISKSPAENIFLLCKPTRLIGSLPERISSPVSWKRKARRY
jgi:hypothetical protein